MTSTPLHPLKQSFEMLVSNLMEPIGQICIVRDGKMLILSVCLVVPAIAKYLPKTVPQNTYLDIACMKANRIILSLGRKC